jgi:hypothetical protein
LQRKIGGHTVILFHLKAFFITFIIEKTPSNLAHWKSDYHLYSHKAVLPYQKMICMPISIITEPEPKPEPRWDAGFPLHPNIDNPPILNIKFGAGAVRSIIIVVEPEPEIQQDAAQAPAPTAPATNLMFNIGGLSKMAYT